MSNLIQPPEDWLNDVIKILRDGDPAAIRWTARAAQNWNEFGKMPFEAYEFLIRTLTSPSILLEPITMDGADETYAFLCQHPLNGPKPLYAKLGLNDGRLRIRIFSMHVDLSGKLSKKINAHLKKK